MGLGCAPKAGLVGECENATSRCCTKHQPGPKWRAQNPDCTLRAALPPTDQDEHDDICACLIL